MAAGVTLENGRIKSSRCPYFKGDRMPEIKCPNCGETITVNDLEDMEKEVFTCPFCHAAVSTDDL